MIRNYENNFESLLTFVALDLNAMENMFDINFNTPVEILNKVNRNSMIDQLGIEYTSVSEGVVEAQMPVDNRTKQPFGILHGGANLALAETVAGLGSALMIDLKLYKPVGIQVNGNHTGTAIEGKVYAKATILHGGRSTHVWNVDIFNDDQQLISTCRVTNMIIPA